MVLELRGTPDTLDTAIPDQAPRNRAGDTAIEAPAVCAVSQEGTRPHAVGPMQQEHIDPHVIAAAHQAAIERTNTPGRWGGELELSIIAKLFNITICVFNRSPNSRGLHHEVVDLTKAYFLNEGGDRAVVNLSFSGNHYDALMDAPVPFGETGHFCAALHTIPGDGNCLYYAVAVGARMPFAWEVSDLYQRNQLQILRQYNSDFRRRFDDIDSMTDEQVRDEFQQTMMVELRSAVSHELGNPEYAERAYWASLAYPD